MRSQIKNSGIRRSGSISRAAATIGFLLVTFFANISEIKAQNNRWSNPVGVWAGNQVRNYYQNRGAYCPPVPPGMPSMYRPAYHVATCAYRAY